MDTRSFLEFLAILVLILGSGFFALSEFSIIASRDSKLRQKAKEKKRGAATAIKLHQNPDRFLASVQIGITLFATLTGVLGGATMVLHLEDLLGASTTPWIAGYAKPISVTVVSIIITVTSVIFGELVPKYLALSNPEKIARLVAPPLNLFTRITAFLSSALSWISNLILRVVGVHRDPTRLAITEDEINHMIFEGKQRGVFDETEEKLIKSVFDFADSTVRRAITPRTDVIGIEVNADPSEIIDLIVEHGYSRYPVFEKTLDNVVGMLYTKDIITHKLNPELIVIKDLIRKPLFVPDSMPLSTLLSLFQKKKKHIAVVLDEYGGTAGVITLEDILEELVGDIQDEYDTDQIPLVKHSETVAYADGSVWPGEINELMDSSLPEDKAETLAGLFIDHLGRLPEKDETVVINDMKISVLERQDNRLVRLKLEKLADSPSQANR
ncbi:MAG TPA: hemolysin family protein [candidate division Zixibacteria bacterium]|nr:hemolysin family protein [candidate division Zixibacteria bacterium]